MDQTILRLLIQEKLVDGRLPHDPLPRVVGGPGQGETCDACGEIVRASELAMEDADAERPTHFHVACFYIWDAERRALNLERSPRLPARPGSEPDAGPSRSWGSQPLQPCPQTPSNLPASIRRAGISTTS
jgi:hypothetical protein